jgi:hypothetical protein
MDTSKTSLQRKRLADGGSPPLLRFEDYKYPDNHTQNGKRLKLPVLLPYKLPNDILNNLGIPQLRLDQLDSLLALNLHSDPSNLNYEKKLQQLKHISESNRSLLSSPINNNINANDTLIKTPITNISRANSQNGDINPINPFQDVADNLKKSAIQFYQEKRYDNSLLDFIQSYLLFALALRNKEIEKESEVKTYKNDTDYAKFLSRKRRDWINVLSLGEKIIDNFTKAIKFEKGKNNPNIEIEKLSHLMGFVYYMNAFIQIHLSDLLMKHINILKNRIEKKDNTELTAQLVKLIDKYEKLLVKIKECLISGEINLGLFVIARIYPKLWSQSFTKLSNIKKNEILLSNKLKIKNPNIPNFKEGVNYCLPICSHTWDLNNIINFGGFFLKEWCYKQSIRHNLVIG